MSPVPENAESIKITLFYRSQAKYTIILDHREIIIQVKTRSGERSRILSDSEIEKVMSYLELLTPKFGNPIHNAEFDLTIESFEFSAIIKWNGNEGTPRHKFVHYIHETLGG